MKIELIIYIYSLFLVFTPNFIFRFSKKLTIPILLLYSFIFTIILYLTYDLVNNNIIENFDISSLNINNINPFTKILNSVIGKNDSIKVNMENDLGQGMILNEDMANTPEALVDDDGNNVLKPISTLISNSPVQEEKLKNNTQKISKQYEESYKKFFLSPYDSNQYNNTNDIQSGCQANYNNPKPCCGQPGTTVSANNVCSKNKPICVGYIADGSLGKCTNNGGISSGKVSILGNYNMKPWLMKDNWSDQNAKWIWINENANILTSPNSNAVFQYVYFLDKSNRMSDYLDIEISIACDCYCYIQMRNRTEIEIDNKIQIGTANGNGIKFQARLYNGENEFNLYCYNEGYENNPAGLLMTVTTNNGKEVLFSTDSSWTWYQTIPLMDSIILKDTKTYLPIVALWNRTQKGFLMMNDNNNISLLESSNKKLYNTLESERTLFQCQKNVVTNEIKSETVSLQNCKNKQYIQLGGKNKFFVEYNSNTSVSFILGGLSQKKYLTITKDNVLELSDVNNEYSQWEIIYIDIVKVGKEREIDTVPKYIGHVGTTSLNMQVNTNDSFITKMVEDQLINGYTNSLKITRVDANYYSSWNQDLVLPGINNIYLEKITPELTKIVDSTKLAIRQIVLYNNTLICLDNNGIIYTKNIYKPKDHWKSITNAVINTYGKTSGLGGNIVIGKFNNKDVLFVVGPLITVSWSDTEKYGAIYYRSLDSLHQPNETWKLYSTQTDGSPIIFFNNITYCDKNEKVYGVSRGNLYEITYNNSYILKTQLTTMSAIEYIVHPLKNTNGYIIGINPKLQIFRQPIDFKSNKLGEILIIANNIEVTKITIVSDLIFALGKQDGKIYYIPLYGGLLKIFNAKLQGNLINITNYNDILYAIDSNNNILKTQIVL